MKRLFQESSYYIRIGSELLNKAIIPDAHFQNTILRFPSNIEREVFIHSMFDESLTIDGARISIAFLKNKTTLDNATECRVKVYRISNDATPWTDTLVKTITLSQGSDKLFKTTLTSAEAGVEIFGDVTFKIHARVMFKNKPHYGVNYFNHLGLTDKVERIRRKLVFIETTKKPPGENYF